MRCGESNRLVVSHNWVLFASVGSLPACLPAGAAGAVLLLLLLLTLVIRSVTAGAFLSPVSKHPRVAKSQKIP